MYIKGLEERIKVTTQNESQRNKALAQEITDLRSATLKVRSEVLKISCALNYIGAEVGRILNVQGSEELDLRDVDAGSVGDSSKLSDLMTYLKDPFLTSR